MGSIEVPLTVHEALSGILGSISLAAWVFLLLPQLYENYRARSAAGISVTFLLIWFVGDLTNLIGAIWASLVPTVVALAAYFCLSDAILILQCLYYNLWVNRDSARVRKSSLATNSSAGDLAQERVLHSQEDEPLLSRVDSNNSYSSIGLPGSHRRRTSTLTRINEDERRSGTARPTGIPEQRSTTTVRSVLLASVKNTGFVLAVCAVGTAGWALAWRTGAWQPAQAPEENHSLIRDDDTPVGASVLGYISAVAYLGARIPQIIKNWRDKSCEGLSLLFFLLSLLGNLTYGAGILCHSLNRNYVITNLPWLIGSLGTMVEDCTIFVQFHMYGDQSAQDPEDSSAIATR